MRSFTTSPPCTVGRAPLVGALAAFASDDFAPGCTPLFSGCCLASIATFISPLAFSSTLKRMLSTRRSSWRMNFPVSNAENEGLALTRPMLAATPGAKPLGFPMDRPSMVKPSVHENCSVSMRASPFSCSFNAATTLGRTSEFTNIGASRSSNRRGWNTMNAPSSSHLTIRRARRGLCGADSAGALMVR